MTANLVFGLSPSAYKKYRRATIQHDYYLKTKQKKKEDNARRYREKKEKLQLLERILSERHPIHLA